MLLSFCGKCGKFLGFKLVGWRVLTMGYCGKCHDIHLKKDSKTEERQRRKETFRLAKLRAEAEQKTHLFLGYK